VDIRTGSSGENLILRTAHGRRNETNRGPAFTEGSSHSYLLLVPLVAYPIAVKKARHHHTIGVTGGNWSWRCMLYRR